MPRLEAWQRAHPEVRVLLISRGEVAENQPKIEQHSLTFPVALQQKWETSRLYATFATPAAYLIDEDGKIADGVAAGAEQIERLLESAAGSTVGNETGSQPAGQSATD